MWGERRIGGSPQQSVLGPALVNIFWYFAIHIWSCINMSTVCKIWYLDEVCCVKTILYYVQELICRTI